MIGFDDGTEKQATLDGHHVDDISADLTSGSRITEAVSLPSNERIAFMGITPSGKFEVDLDKARHFLAEPNASSSQNRSVLRPWINASEITRRVEGRWIIDFGCDVDIAEAAQFEAPFRYVQEVIAPARAEYRTGKRGYWCFERPRPEMRAALSSRRRFIATPLVSKHRVFTYVESETLCANLIIVFAREDEVFFGTLHSSIHELWALRMGTRLEDRPRYTPTTCFETFPLPWPPARRM
jgi:hypothetical protein